MFFLIEEEQTLASKCIVVSIEFGRFDPFPLSKLLLSIVYSQPLLIVLVTACMKNTAQKTTSKLPQASFTPTEGEERRKCYGLKLKLLHNQTASNSEESPMQQEEWMSITPTLEWGSSPVIERTGDQWNAEYEQAQAPWNMEELDTLVQDLRDNPPTPTATLAPPADTATEKQDLAAPNLDKELPTPTSTTPAVFTETIAETPKQPLLKGECACDVGTSIGCFYRSCT